MNNNELTKDELISFFSDGCKEKKKWRIGTEHEKFGFRKKKLWNQLDILILNKF